MKHEELDYLFHVVAHFILNCKTKYLINERNTTIFIQMHSCGDVEIFLS